jgi:hypothetical protein
MAENKKSFLLYVDQIHLFEALSDEEAGKLVKHIFRYVNDLNPETPDRITQISFEPIKHQLKRDLVKYKEKLEQWSEAGKKSAESKKLKKYNDSQQNSTNVNGCQQTSTESTVIDTDTVIVIDTVKDIDTYIGLRKNIFNEYDTELKTKLSKYKIDRPICFIGTGIPVMYYDLVEILVICINDIEWQKDIQNRFGLLKYEKSLIDFFLTVKASSEYTKYKGENDFKRHYTNWLNKNTDKYKK